LRKTGPGARLRSQRFEAFDPRPLAAQRFRLHLPQTPKLLAAGIGIVAGARSRPPAFLVGAESERSQQVALRAPHQRDALEERDGLPLFERQPARIAFLPRNGLSFHVGPIHRPLSRERISAIVLAMRLHPSHAKPL